MANNYKKAAFNCFKAWTKRYDVKIIIKNEQALIKDFEISLEKALKSLVEGKNFSHKGVFQKAKNYGYIWGFLSSNLGMKWHMDYVAPRSKIFQQIQSLRAIIDLLKFDKLLDINHGKIFTELIESKVPNLDFEPDNHLELLDSLFENMTNDFVEHLDFECVPTDVIEGYFGDDALDGVIRVIS